MIARSVEAMRARVPAGHLRVVEEVYMVAGAAMETAQYETAEPLLEEALVGLETVGQGAVDAAYCRARLDRVCDATGQTEEARKAFDEAIAALGQIPGETAGLARVLWRSGRARLARRHVEGDLPELEVAVVGTKVLPADSEQLAEYRETLEMCRGRR